MWCLVGRSVGVLANCAGALDVGQRRVLVIILCNEVYWLVCKRIDVLAHLKVSELEPETLITIVNVTELYNECLIVLLGGEVDGVGLILDTCEGECFGNANDAAFEYITYCCCAKVVVIGNESVERCGVPCLLMSITRIYIS